MIINKNKNFCYRICHIDNVADILQNGICSKHHPNASKNYISIGNPGIIDARDSTPVKLSGYGSIGEYVPFYFTPKSMMLFNIITGYRAPLVPKRNKEEIVIFRCLIDELSKLGKFFFSDGQANVTSITDHFNDLNHLDQIDWELIHKSDFKKDLEDVDKPRRYQAEFLVYHHVPIEYVESINVYNEKAAKFVRKEIAKTDLMLKVNIIPGYFFE